MEWHQLTMLQYFISAVPNINTPSQYNNERKKKKEAKDLIKSATELKI